jgi:hypothetical protein
MTSSATIGFGTLFQRGDGSEAFTTSAKLSISSLKERLSRITRN